MAQKEEKGRGGGKAWDSRSKLTRGNPTLFLPSSLASGKFLVFGGCFIICKMSRVLSILKDCYADDI